MSYMLEASQKISRTFWHFLRNIRNRLGLFYSVRNNITYGQGFHVGPGSIIDAPSYLNIGDNVYIGKNCTIECDGAIGNHVLIANTVGLIGRYDHDFSIVGMNIRESPHIRGANYKGPGKDLKIIIEDDVWIGYGAIILSGVIIGRGAIVAAGSVVTADVPPYGIAVGSPARVKRYRFTPEEIKKHEQALYGHSVNTLSHVSNSYRESN